MTYNLQHTLYLLYNLTKEWVYNVNNYGYIYVN